MGGPASQLCFPKIRKPLSPYFSSNSVMAAMKLTRLCVNTCLGLPILLTVGLPFSAFPVLLEWSLQFVVRMGTVPLYLPLLGSSSSLLACCLLVPSLPSCPLTLAMNSESLHASLPCRQDFFLLCVCLLHLQGSVQLTFSGNCIVHSK